MLFTKIVFIGALLYDNLQNAVLDTSCFSAFSSSSELSLAKDTRSSPLLHAMACSSLVIAASSLTTAGLIGKFYRPHYQQQRHWRLQAKVQVYSAYRASIPAVKPPTSRVYVPSLLRTTSPVQRIPQQTSVNRHVHPTFEWTPEPRPQIPTPTMAPLAEASRPVSQHLPLVVAWFSLVVAIAMVLCSVICLDMENEHHLDPVKLDSDVSAAVDDASASPVRAEKPDSPTVAPIPRRQSKTRSQSKAKSSPRRHAHGPSPGTTPALCRFIGGRRFGHIQPRPS